MTILYSIWGVYSGISGYFNADKSVEVSEKIDKILEEAMDEMDDELQGVRLPILDRMTEAKNEILTPYFVRKNSIAVFLGSLLTLIAAFTMLKLKKTGFYLYLFGKLLLFIIPFSILQGMALGYAIGLNLFIVLIFVPMYVVNLKQMS